MSVSIRRAMGLTAALALTACKPVTPDAVIVSREGTATVRKRGVGTPLDALLNSSLFEADVVMTGADGIVTLAFTGGNTLTLQPDTTVLIRRGGATGAELGAVVVAGSARASSPGATRRLVIGSPFGMTELGGSQLVVDVDLVKGLSVLIGEVSVIKDGNATLVEAGSMLSIDGLVVPVGGSRSLEVAGLTTVLEPRKATLITTSRVVQVRAPSGNDWVAAEPRQTLDPGAAVRTRKAHGTQVRFDDGSSVALDPNSELLFEEAKGNDRQQKARYSLASGAADLRLTRHEGVEASHEVSVAGLGIDVRPGDREAEVDLKSAGSGAYEVGVRFGRVRLSDGTEIDAGNAVTVKDGKVAGEPRPVATTGVELRAGTTSVVYYQGAVPPIAFDWRTDDNEAHGGFQITVATDKAMKDVVFSETVRKTGFVYDQFRAGRYFWRVKTGDTVREGTLLIQRGGENDCANCKRVNIIHDTGEKTVVFFQQALPALTFQWKAVAGASQYRLKVFADGSFERPLLEATSPGTNLPFQAGALEEGKYFWLVNAVDTAGKPLAQSGRTNGLEIAYDNVINDLVIRSPKNGQRISGDRITTTGELVLGARLYVNGKAADLDGKGRFKLSVALPRSERSVVYRTVATDGVQRYYVRELRR